MMVTNYPPLKMLCEGQDELLFPEESPVKESEGLTWEVIQKDLEELKAVADQMKYEKGLANTLIKNPSPKASTQSLAPRIFDDYSSDTSSSTSSTSSLSGRGIEQNF